MFERIRLRLAQTARYFRRGVSHDTPWHQLLTPEAAAAFATLPDGDQRHALAVAKWLDEQGAPTTLVSAGLLHDIGKAVPGVSVHLPDRVAKVVLARVAPGQLEWIAAWDAPRWPFGGLWVLSRHARSGGEMVRSWGYPDRVAWLVEHHEDRVVTDSQLALLVAVDDGRPVATTLTGVANG